MYNVYTIDYVWYNCVPVRTCVCMPVFLAVHCCYCAHSAWSDITFDRINPPTHQHNLTSLLKTGWAYLSLSVFRRKTVAVVSLHTLFHLVFRPHTSPFLSLTGNCGHVTSPKNMALFYLKFCFFSPSPSFCVVYHFIFNIFELIQKFSLIRFGIPF